MKTILSTILATLLLTGVASAATYEDGVREHFLQRDLPNAPALKARVQEFTNEGYTQVGEAKVIYLQTYRCSPGCTHTFLVAQSYHATDNRVPASKTLVAVYDLLVTAGQIKEYYYTLAKVPSDDELGQALSLAQ